MWSKRSSRSLGKALLLSALSGVFYGLSQPGIGLWPLGWFSLLPLLYAVNNRRPKEAFSIGSFGGTVAFLVTCFWIVVAVNRYGGINYLGALAILLLLCLYLGLYFGVFSLGVTVLPKNTAFAFGGASLWTLLEYLRGHLLTGFPWAMLSHSQWRIPILLQISDLGGAHLLSFLMAFFNLALFLSLKGKRKALFYALIGIGLSLGYGLFRINEKDPSPRYKVAIIQPNIEQLIKWDKAFQRQILKIHKLLTLKTLSQKPDLIIWPETAFPQYFPQGELVEELLQFLHTLGTPLVFGALRVEKEKTFNSAFLFSQDKLSFYDKVHLVPFGEYLPFRNTIERLFGSVKEAVPGDISPGEEIKVLILPWGKAGILICFEIIFPELSNEAVKRGAELLITITNDAWFGKTSAPYQHLAQAVFRSVEQRRWILRSANTGISAVINPKGRIIKETPLFKRCYFVAPFDLSKKRTLYGETEKMWPFLFLGIFILSNLQRSNRNRSF